MAKNGLSAPQQRAIVALMDPRNRTTEAAAQAAGVSRRTVDRWLATELFADELRAAQAQALEHATRRLAGLQDAAITTQGQLLHDHEVAPGVRRATARDVLEMGLRLADAVAWEQRLREVEDRLNER